MYNAYISFHEFPNILDRGLIWGLLLTWHTPGKYHAHWLEEETLGL